MWPFSLWVQHDAASDGTRLALAILGLAALGWGYWLAHEGRPTQHQRPRDRLLMALGLLGAIAYPNWGQLHFGNFIHTWDTYHYYVGSKYFPELGYDRLYECTAVADLEVGYEAVKKRVITDLRTNDMVKVDQILAHPERCKQHFTPARWADFVHDVQWFRKRVGAQRWEEIQHDHGYNATPVWNMLGHALANLSRANLVQVTFLALLDPLLLLGAAALLYWAFGWRVTAVALLVLGTSYPNRYYWTGGAFLRHDWLFWLVACVCLLKKERYFLAGASIAYATLLRLFPGFVVVGPVLAAADLLIRERRLDRRYLRFFAGGAAATLLLVGASFVLSGGVETYQRFWQNTVKHANTPLTNHMGLRTALSYRPSTIGARLRDGSLTDPWSVWKAARLRNFEQLKPLFYLAVLGSMALLYFAVRHSGHVPWMAASMSVAMIAVGAELTCYYYCFVIALAPLALLRREVGLLLVAWATVTQAIGQALFRGWSTWLDEQYTAMSFASLVAFGGVVWCFTRHGEKSCLPAEPIVATPEPAESKPKPERKKRKKRR